MNGADKFSGCLIGGLVGDSFGFLFEFRLQNPERVKKIMSKLKKLEGPELIYTDDTAMAWNIIDSLISRNGYNPMDMARRFTETWKNESFRLYGSHISTVFLTWEKNNYCDVYTPAKKQFGGKGSSGNGGAMRIAPIALYWCHDHENMTDLAVSITKLTHTNPHGYMGALIQCCAVRIAIKKDCRKRKLDSDSFIDLLMKYVDEYDDQSAHKAKTFYLKELGVLKNFLHARDNTVIETIIATLGNEVVAQRSVLTAIFCFLRAAAGPIDYIITDNPFERTIYLALCLGGDADTIACMAGGIAGAYYGLSGIPEYMPKCCQEVDRAHEYSKKFYKRFVKLGKPK